MSAYKPAPLVTDQDFDIRTPGFIVVHGHVLHVMAVQYNLQHIMGTNDIVSYKRHGAFKICCIHEGYAVIEHTTLSGKVAHLFVPNKQWLNVSNGSYSTFSPHYPSFEQAYHYLADET